MIIKWEKYRACDTEIASYKLAALINIVFIIWNPWLHKHHSLVERGYALPSASAYTVKQVCFSQYI